MAREIYMGVPQAASVETVALIPIMTSNTAPSGVVTAAANADTAYKAFRQALPTDAGDTAYSGYGASLPWWIGYEFPTEQEITSFDLYFAYPDGSYSKASTGYISVTTDGSTWDQVASFSSLAQGTTHTITLDSPTRCKAFRVYLTAYNNSYSSGSCRAGMIQAYGNQYKPEGEFARHIPKFYLGIADVARLVRKAYMGVAGVARPTYGGGTLTYYGKTTSMGAAHAQFAGAQAGKGLYAVFGGGQTTGNNATDEVAAFDKNYTFHRPGLLRSTKIRLSAAAVGDYALLAGGEYMWSYSPVATVDVYDAQLVKSTAADLITKKSSQAAASFGDYAVFAGGNIASDGGYSQMMDCYDATLAHTSVTLKYGANRNAAATIGKKYLIIAGGYAGLVPLASADAYDENFTRLPISDLSKARQDFCGVGIGKYALFAGGKNSTNQGLDVVDAYDENLARITAPVLNAGRVYVDGAALGDYAVLAGGTLVDSWNGVNNVDAYDTHLTKVDVTQMEDGRRGPICVVVGDSLLIAGGYSASGAQLNTVEAYTII